MISCPPKNEKRFQDLVAAVGEKEAYLAFFRNGNSTPGIDAARVHLATRPADYRAPVASQKPVVVSQNGPIGQETGAVVPETPPFAPPEVPIEQRPLAGEEAKARLVEIDRALQAVDEREVAAGPFKTKIAVSLAEEKRALLEERLQRQAELGSTEAGDALQKHLEETQVHGDLGVDDDALVRKFFESHPIDTAAQFKGAGHEHADAVRELFKESGLPKRALIMGFKKGGSQNLDNYGEALASYLKEHGVAVGNSGDHFTEAGVLDRIKEAYAAPKVLAPIPPRVEMRLPIVASAPPRSEVVKPEPFKYGAVAEGSPTVDFRTLEGAGDFDPSDWAREVGAAMDAGQRGGKSGNRADTRVALAMQAPDGRVELRGLVRPQQTPRVGRVARSLGEVALQRMGTDREGGRVVDATGNRPAHVEDVVQAGYKPLAVIHFDGDPAKIAETYDNASAFDEAWRVSDKTTLLRKGDAAPKEVRGPILAAKNLEADLNSRIDDIGRRYERADPAEQAEMKEELDKLYADLDVVTRNNQSATGEVPFRTMEESEHLMPISAERAREFQAVVARLRNQGGKVDEFAKELFNQGSEKVIRGQIASLEQKLAGATGPAKRALQEAITYREQRIKDLSEAGAVTFNPWHIAVAMNNVQQADVGDLVRLLHEAAEMSSLHLNTVMRGTIVRAVESSIVELRARAAARSLETGVPLSRETGALDLLSETLAQKLAAENIPDHPAIIDQMIRWVKDLYYRVAMAAQAAFGVQPDPKLALDWFENQMNRLVHGDYDQRMGRILDRYLVEPLVEVSRRFTGHGNTPGGLVDYLDPIDQTMRQPAVDPIAQDAIGWNVVFRTTAGSPGEEQDIPDPEARARIDGAALNRLIDFADRLKEQVAPDMKWEQFWRTVGRGDDPKGLVTQIEQRFKGAGAARIGGERMTEPMNDLASLRARQLLEKYHFKAIRDAARARESAEGASEALTDAAKETNKLEGDVRNAAMHDDILKLYARDLVRTLVRDYNRGLDTAESHGELAEAVRRSEGLLETDPIPERFQQVFKQLSDGGVSIFGYMREIAKLDLPLSDMTNGEVLKAIRENGPDTPILEELGRNKPLAVALAVLARKNAAQVDQIQLGWLRNTEKFQDIHADLQEIRDATPQALRAMQEAVDQRVKAKGLKERLHRAYLEKRTELKTAQARVDRAIARADLLDKAIPHLAAEVKQLQIAGAGALSEWTPKNNTEWTAMTLQPDGQWKKFTRTLQFAPDGSAVDAAGIRSAIAENFEWLDQNRDDAGSQFYESVKRQTTELAHLDVQKKYQAGHVSWIDRWVQPIGDEAAALGGAGARVKQMLLNMQRILYFHNSDLEVSSHAWTKALQDVEAASGITDHGQFFQQVYSPVMYFLGTNPGLDEGPAIREATRLARARIPQNLKNALPDDFNAKFAEFLRKTRDTNQKIEAIANKEGAFVRDPRLRSELRSAVARGWITGMRGMDAGVVSTIIRDMEKAGWRLEMKEVENSTGEKTQRIVRATTFDHFKAADMAESKSDPLRKSLAQYFTPSIVQRWLEPFINKGGVEILKHEGEAIPQADLQDAWQSSAGDVLAWIDALAAKMDLPEKDEQHPDPLAAFRFSVLNQLNGLFGMESRMAYDASQSRSMFDPMGPKPHVIMDARQNDLLPPEHLNFQTFDPKSTQGMLGQIAFHASFGRNGERAISAVNELKASLSLRHQEYQSLKGTTKASRVAEAAARGWKYKELETAARRYDDVLSMQQKLEGIFGVNNPAGPFNDMRGGMEVLNAMAGQIVDNPKVGLYHVISLLERPFAMKSLGPLTLKASAGAGADFLKTAFGSMLESLNIHLLHSSEYAKEVGAVQGSAFRNQPWSRTMADIGQAGKFQDSLTGKYLIRPLRMLRYIQQKGVRIGPGEGAREFPRFAAIPGLGVLNTIMQTAATANTTAQVRMMETMVARGMKYFSTHREEFEDPSFRFKPGDLVGKWDKGVFDYFRNKTVEYGMGNLEDIVRSAMPAAAKGERLINKDQVLRLSMMAANELDGASSINTTPSILQSNPILRIGMPLLRWPLWKMHQAHEGLKDAEGRQNAMTTLRGLGTLALWNLPMGLAFSFLMDRYDEKLLHKKSMLPPLDATAAIPIAGPALNLATSDRSIPQNLLAYLERGAKAGNIYGLAADMVSQFAAPLDPASGQRAFSLDQRVLVMSQFLNFQQAVRNLINQGGDTSWASFWKPFAQSLGGNGALQAVDLVNNALGLDNEESRLTMRINASSWLRSAGEEAGVELRAAGGGSEAPNPMTVWVREMQLAAMSGDRLGFLDAHRKALEAARRAVADDPHVSLPAREREASTRVLTAWRSRDPLEVFRYRPTGAQMSAIMRNMDESGQQDVRQALARYHQFTALITPSAEERTFQRQEIAMLRPPDYVSARKQNTALLYTSP